MTNPAAQGVGVIPEPRLLSVAPAVAGVLDASIVLVYMAGINAESQFGYLMAWYSATLLLKAAIAWALWRDAAPLTRQARFTLVATAAMTAATTFAGVASLAAYAAVTAFLAHLTLTLVIIGRLPLRRYLGGAAALITAAAGLHLALCLLHRMDDQWGRFLYFGHNHPNLGGEIDAVGAMAAALSIQPRRYSLAMLAILVLDAAMLQARSAMLVGGALFLIMSVVDPRRPVQLRPAIVLALAGLLGFLVLAELGISGKAADALSSVFLLDNQYRGLGSGASGRSDLWNQAIYLFDSSPFYGHSLDYFSQIGFIGAHNLFLHGLAQYGVMAIPFLLSLFYAYIENFRHDRFRFIVLSLALPLFLFNDRFINLNPYPFFVYALLLAPASDAEGLAPRPATRVV